MREHLKNYFKFSKTEKRGALALSSFLLLIMALIWFKPFKPDDKTLVNADKFKEHIAQFYEADSLKKKEFESRYKKNYPKKTYTSSYEKKEFKKAEKPPIEPIDINLATEHDFDKLKGIGEVLAQRIIQYRQKLGGFYSTSQLKEVYGIKPEVVDQNKTYLIVTKAGLSKLNINNSEFKILLKHPYLEYNDVKKIFRLRDSLKTISLQDVQRALHDSTFTKVFPYLE
jgi:competence protein ComEA